MNIWKINGSEQELVHAVYDILRLCGEDMYENQGLMHWRIPYPLERIVDDCKIKEIYLAIEENESIATFQLSSKDNMMELSKFGVLPSKSGQGIGGKCMRYMEDMCRTRSFQGICLDVYDKSKVAICFYEKHGFVRGDIQPAISKCWRWRKSCKLQCAIPIN